MFYIFIYISVIVVIAILFPLIMSKFLKTENPLAAITSNSMWPIFKKGDLIFIKQVDLEQVQSGDIVVWKNENGFVIHRVEKIDNSKKILVTKGDANNISDEPINFSDVIGEVVMLSHNKPLRIPLLGNITILVKGLGSNSKSL